MDVTLRRRHRSVAPPASAVQVSGQSDAYSTLNERAREADTVEAGAGGYTVERAWRVSFTGALLRAPISGLELLAFCLHFIYNADLASLVDFVTHYVDNVNAYLALTSESAASPFMQWLYDAIRAHWAFKAFAHKLRVGQRYGKWLLLADAASRNYVQVVDTIAQRMRVNVPWLPPNDDVVAMVAQADEAFARIELTATPPPVLAAPPPDVRAPRSSPRGPAQVAAESEQAAPRRAPQRRGRAPRARMGLLALVLQLTGVLGHPSSAVLWRNVSFDNWPATPPRSHAVGTVAVALSPTRAALWQAATLAARTAVDDKCEALTQALAAVDDGRTGAAMERALHDLARALGVREVQQATMRSVHAALLAHAREGSAGHASYAVDTLAALHGVSQVTVGKYLAKLRKLQAAC